MNLEKFEPVAYYDYGTISYGLYAEGWGYYADAIFMLLCFTKKCRLPQLLTKDTNQIEISTRPEKFKGLREECVGKQQFFRWEPSPAEYKLIIHELVREVTATTSAERRKKYKEGLNCLQKNRKNKSREAFSLKEIYNKVRQKLYEERLILMGSSTGVGTTYIICDTTNSTVG